MTIFFYDTLFSVEKVSKDFMVRKFDLSIALTDESTYISSGPFFDWLDENPVIAVPNERHKDLELWFESLEWIDKKADSNYKNVMLRNQWQNFFLAFESIVKPLLTTAHIETISPSRDIFQRFCLLLYENCLTHHDVKFYADKLFITPYYLSKITSRILHASPKEMIDRQLIMEIKILLTTTTLTVSEIADKRHFESASYLGRYFRRHIGMTPLDYRKLQAGVHPHT